MLTPLVCSAFAPGAPDNPTDVLDVESADGQIRLTIRREGKLSLNLRWNDDADGRAQAEAMMGDLARSFRPPTEEELRTIPDLMTPVQDAEPEDAMLCMQWDIDGRDADAALDLRNEVLEQSEALLDEEGLLIDWEGASIGMGTVETTFSVTDFEAAKSLLLNKLSAGQKAHNFRIYDETAA